ncbi:MAG: peptidoglycan editing factor PgeF [Hyphomonadaceae bacterium]|nr:peptidoglycan editing factor PgeF [Hyphomonadaceae bacterium]MBC6412297.1 peptidoglycan editing factor PgeF [Hyphomonadaceae bacterium]
MRVLSHPYLDHPGVEHGFFTRKGGVSEDVYASLNVGAGSKDRPENIAENRRRVAAHMGTEPTHLLSLYQAHSTEVIIVDRPFAGRPKADGLVTRTPGLALSTLAADCGPVLFCEPRAGVIGACHAGWRGSFSGIIDSTIDAMESIGARREDTYGVLGPSISQANYEVGHDYRNSLMALDESCDRFFRPGPEKEDGSRKPHFDLKGFILYRLRTAGLGHVNMLPNCTYGEPDLFFSYRYNIHQGVNDYGRNISAIMLTK